MADGAWKWKSGPGTGHMELGTEKWQLRSRQVAFLFNFKSGKIYITLVACTSTPAPCHTVLLPGVCMSCGAGHSSHVECSHVACVVRGKLKLGFNFSIRQRRAVNNAITHPRCNLLIKIFNWLFTYIFWRRRRRRRC